MSRLDLMQLVRVCVWQRFNPATGEYEGVSEATHIPGTDLQPLAITTVRTLADTVHRPGSGNVRVVVDVWEPESECWRHVATLRIYKTGSAPFVTLRNFWENAPTVALRTVGAVAIEAERYGWDASDVRESAGNAVALERVA